MIRCIFERIYNKKSDFFTLILVLLELDIYYFSNDVLRNLVKYSFLLKRLFLRQQDSGKKFKKDLFVFRAINQNKNFKYIYCHYCVNLYLYSVKIIDYLAGLGIILKFWNECSVTMDNNFLVLYFLFYVTCLLVAQQRNWRFHL